MDKQHREFVYSILIIVAIPLLIVANTIFIIRSVRTAYNLELRRSANSANTVIAESLREGIIANNSQELTATINKIVSNNLEVSQIFVIKTNGNALSVVAQSQDVTNRHIKTSEALQRIVFDKKVPVARLISVNEESGEAHQAWLISSPLLSSDGKKVLAIVSSSVSTKTAQAAISSMLKIAVLSMAVTIIVVILLLLRHMRLLSYGKLLAKEREVNQTMSDFLSVATHELKAPMSIIKGYISNVVEDTQPPLSNDAKEQLGVALAQTDRLNGLVQDLLNVSRIDQGGIEYNLQPIVMNEVLTPIVKNYVMIASEKQMTITYAPQPDYVVYADAGRVQEIFTNLVDNAVKYSKQGTVTIGMQLSGNKIRVSVRDTGIGMDEEHRKRLFQRFYRIKTEETKDISGTGLGLWIIKQYTEAMGGTISVQSTVGSGSEFTVELPLYQKQTRTS
jgi:signal transduction histidine kinase